MRFETLSAWLAWLEQCHPREIDLGLDRIRVVAERMGLLRPSAKVVIVGGTNGKGSCVTATAALLHAAGHKVGVYTSPHIQNYNERIVIDGQQASDAEICAAFELIYSAAQPRGLGEEPISLTYFEYGTLAAFEVFRQQQVTAMVLEVGLGGKLDAVNILDADVSLVTSIDIDHQDWLGDNREDIGREKAGIYRAARPAICADSSPPQSLLNVAADIGAELRLINKDFGFESGNHVWSWWGSVGRFIDMSLPHLPLPSLAAALAGIDALGISVNQSSFELLAQLKIPGRFQVIECFERQIILDVAHNPAATAYLANRLAALDSQQTLGLEPRKVHGIVAMMSDKDRRSSLENLINLVDCWYLVDLDNVPRAASSEQVKKNLADLGVAAEFTGTLEVCLQEAVANSKKGDTILIFGSFFTVSAGLQVLNQSCTSL